MNNQNKVRYRTFQLRSARQSDTASAVADLKNSLARTCEAVNAMHAKQQASVAAVEARLGARLQILLLRARDAQAAAARVAPKDTNE